MDKIWLEQVLDCDDLEATAMGEGRLDDGVQYYFFGINHKEVADMGWIIQPKSLGLSEAKMRAQSLLDETIHRLRLEMSPLKINTSFTVFEKGKKYEQPF